MKGGLAWRDAGRAALGGTAFSLAVLREEERRNEGHRLTRLRAAHVGNEEVQVRGKEGEEGCPEKGKAKMLCPVWRRKKKKLNSFIKLSSPVLLE